MALTLNRILHGDCCQVLADLPDACVDFALTDPPYLVNYRDRAGRSLAGDRDAGWLQPAFAQTYRLLRPDSLCVSFYGWNRVDLFFRAWKECGFRVVGHFTFPKRYTSSSRLVRYQHENAYLLAKGNPRPGNRLIGDVIDWTYSGNLAHPTQKPTSVLRPLIEAFCKRGGVVLDPFAGSGSTCVAARSTGRHYIGVEIDGACHRVAVQRMQALITRSAQLVAWDESQGRTANESLRGSHQASASV